MNGVEDTFTTLVGWIEMGVEVVGVALIAIGVVVTVFQALRGGIPGYRDYQQIRLTLSHFLVVALEFQLAADLLSTAVAPSWDQLGKLASIAVIRTFLNFFLTHEVQEIETSRVTSSGRLDQ